MSLGDLANETLEEVLLRLLRLDAASFYRLRRVDRRLKQLVDQILDRPVPAPGHAHRAPARQLFVQGLPGRVLGQLLRPLSQPTAQHWPRMYLHWRAYQRRATAAALPSPATPVFSATPLQAYFRQLFPGLQGVKATALLANGQTAHVGLSNGALLWLAPRSGLATEAGANDGDDDDSLPLVLMDLKDYCRDPIRQLEGIDFQAAEKCARLATPLRIDVDALLVLTARGRQCAMLQVRSNDGGGRSEAGASASAGPAPGLTLAFECDVMTRADSIAVYGQKVAFFNRSSALMSDVVYVATPDGVVSYREKDQPPRRRTENRQQHPYIDVMTVSDDTEDVDAFFSLWADGIVPRRDDDFYGPSDGFFLGGEPPSCCPQSYSGQLSHEDVCTPPLHFTEAQLVRDTQQRRLFRDDVFVAQHARTQHLLLSPDGRHFTCHNPMPVFHGIVSAVLFHLDVLFVGTQNGRVAAYRLPNWPKHADEFDLKHHDWLFNTGECKPIVALAANHEEGRARVWALSTDCLYRAFWDE